MSSLFVDALKRHEASVDSQVLARLGGQPRRTNGGAVKSEKE